VNCLTAVGCIKSEDWKKELTMTERKAAKCFLSVLTGALVLFVLVGCRHEETVVIASADPIETAVEENASAEPGDSAHSNESVTPIPYRSPVVTEPRSTVPNQASASPRAVLAQYSPPAPKPAPAPRPTPVLVTVPVGTLVRVQIENHLSSHTSQVGQQFSATITQDVAAEGRVAIQRGARVLGRVTEAEPAKKIGGRARLSLDFETLDLGSGQQRPMSAQFAQAGKSQTAKDAAIIGGSTIGGAIIGEAIEDGEGGVIGAIVGGLGGAYAAKKTKAKPVEVPAGTMVDLELTQPITLEIYVD
jgi:hypothetical protein